MRSFRSVLLILLIALPLVAGTGYWLLDRRQYETTDDAYLQSNIVLISPRVQGYVTQIAVNDNQAVKQNDVLVMIDDRDYQARVIQAEANVSAEIAHIQRLRAMKASQRAHVETAGANIAAVQARREHIQKDLERFQNLIDRGSAARQSLDKVESESKQAAAELRGSQSAANAEHTQLATLDIEITETEARLENAKAQLSLAKIDLEHTQIKAPVDGIIGNRGVQLGQLVRPGVALASLVQNSKIWVEANFKETQLEHMRLGQPVTIKVDAYPDLELTGKVDSFSPASGSEFSILPEENATGNFTKIVRRVPVKIVFDASENIQLLRPGLSAEVKVKVH
ncbi:MAG: HlyD family secretion protein [Methylobacter tundripaludum]|uniref:Membrane fusion protein (Multidrug efflux system) n=1 Tax=Methylobacter tundripaludum TaxID=173365 RepID=A0A2S6H561_9GAMM|nr:HlyD family secretion protein [Methylobacter tundripaludum]MCF7966721.1 HlyD family secretion protein [Methylobacter tundripaludum]MCK9636151.1 HlyD family secretion protein [Methylobacter tundripaludum]PPK72625.1 membrane fusion protein (multidrug efflux system) [Methylobacter tundripaludum]